MSARLSDTMLACLTLNAHWASRAPRSQRGWISFDLGSYRRHGFPAATLRALYRRKLIDGCSCHEGTDGCALMPAGIEALATVTEEQKQRWHSEAMRRGMRPFCWPGRALELPRMPKRGARAAVARA